MIRRTVCGLCLSLVLGILYGSCGSFWFLAGFALLLLSTGVMLSRLCKRAGRVILVRSILSLCLFGAGMVHVQNQQAVRTELEDTLSEGEQITVRGQISKKEEKDQQFIYYLKDTRVVSGGMAYPSYGILIYSSDGQYQPGNLLKVTGRYAPFQISRNEGNFNEKQYQQSKKWEFRVCSDSEVLLSDRENRYKVFLEKLRQSWRKVFIHSMSAENAGVMANMTLGDKSLMDGEIRELYQTAGISHILAISGLHVSILGMGILGLMRKLGCPRWLGAVTAVTVVYSFGTLSGMEVSTFRAVSMFILMVVAQITGCSYDSLTALSLSAVIQLWENPFLLEYAGFLFSYGAVLGVTVVAKVLRGNRQEAEKKEGEKRKKQKEEGRKEQGERQKRTGGIGKMVLEKIKASMYASFCIQLATLPLSLYFYYEISCCSILANGCILPFMGILLCLGATGAALGSLVPILGKIILMPAGGLLSLTEEICHMFLKLPGAELITGKPQTELMFLYYGVLVLCLYLIWCRRQKRWYAGVVCALLCLLFVREKPQFEIDVLDVGQGDGILIQTETGEHFFVDGGSSDVKQVGKYRILPFLKCRGIRSVKGWLVSHADSDHISGLKELLQTGYPVETLILAEGMVRDEAMEELVETAEKAGCQILYVTPGMKFGAGDAVFTVLAPEEGETGTDRNSNSLAVLLKCKDFAGIFTGDMGSEQEEKLVETGCLKAYGIEKVEFYKAAHHGSDGSNSQCFLDRICPQMTVISCGADNSYGHPGKEALLRIQQAGSRIFTTMEQGQIRVRQKGEDVRVWTYLP